QGMWLTPARSAASARRTATKRPKKDHLGTIAAKHVRAQPEARLGDPYLMAVPAQQPKASLPTDEIPEVVTQDGTGHRRQADQANVQPVGRAGIDRRGDQHGLARQRDTH